SLLTSTSCGGENCHHNCPLAAAATCSTDWLELLLRIIGVLAQSDPARYIPPSPSGCRATCVADGAMMMGYCSLKSSTCVDRFTDAGSAGLPATRSTQSKACRLR